MTPDDLAELLDEERRHRGRVREFLDLTLAERLDEDEDDGRLRGGL